LIAFDEFAHAVARRSDRVGDTFSGLTQDASGLLDVSHSLLAAIQYFPGVCSRAWADALSDRSF
jgi:hypothetical protein